jgi:sulfur carrier protein
MKVNGKEFWLERKQTLAEFLKTQQLDCKAIAVERNGVIVPKAEYDHTELADADILEIVQFVGGG